MDKISIIIPAFNVERYVGQCLQSILRQQYNNIEVIVIDDGSTDRTGDICDDYARLDSRIKVVHKKNEGVSAARNVGLDLATGEYIAFVDADDTVEPDIYSFCVQQFKNKGADIVIIMSNNIDERGTRKNKPRDFKEETLDQIDAIRHLVNGDKYGCACYSKIFTNKVINSLRFNTKLAVNEDFLFCFYGFLRAENIFFTGRYLYNYRKRRDSVTSERFSLKSFDSIIAAKEMYEFCCVKQKDLEEIAFKRLISVYIATYNKSIGTEGFDDKRLEIVKDLRSKCIHVCRCSEISMRDKLAVILLTTSSLLYQKMYRIAYHIKEKA